MYNTKKLKSFSNLQGRCGAEVEYSGGYLRVISSRHTSAKIPSGAPPEISGPQGENFFGAIEFSFWIAELVGPCNSAVSKY